MSTIRRSISTKVPDIGRSDQRISALTWNRLTTPLPRCSPVTSGVPSSSEAQLLVASTASGSASTCRLTVTSFGTARPANGPSAAKAARCCGFSQVRLPPRLRPPRRSLTGTRSSSACASRGPAKRTSTPPCSIQALRRSRISGDSVPTSASTIIGSFWSRNCVIACCGAPRVAEPHVGERRQRAGEIEGRCQQRLRGIAGRAADDADGAAAPALVEQLHRAGGAFAGDFEPRDVVAQFDRQVERGFGLAVLRRKGVARLADRRALLVERAHDAGGDAAVGAQHLHRHLRRGVFGGGQRKRRRRAAFEDRQRAIADGLAEAFDEFRPAPGIDAVRQPGDLAVAGGFQEALDRGQGFDPLDRHRVLAQAGAARRARCRPASA